MNNKNMKKIMPALFIVLLITIGNISITTAIHPLNDDKHNPSLETNNGYGLQWSVEYGSSAWTDARYQGPQPIGDSDNDGKNELLISGRDSAIRVMEWNEQQQTYEQVHI